MSVCVRVKLGNYRGMDKVGVGVEKRVMVGRDFQLAGCRCDSHREWGMLGSWGMGFGGHHFCLHYVLIHDGE